jgi:hypothetical protein
VMWCDVVVMLSVADLSTILWAVERRMESYYSKIDCHEVSLFLDEWGWSEPGVVLLVERRPMSDSKPNSMCEFAIWLLGILEICIAACPVSKSDNSWLQQLSVSCRRPSEVHTWLRLVERAVPARPWWRHRGLHMHKSKFFLLRCGNFCHIVGGGIFWPTVGWHLACMRCRQIMYNHWQIFICPQNLHRGNRAYPYQIVLGTRYLFHSVYLISHIISNLSIVKTIISNTLSLIFGHGF